MDDFNLGYVERLSSDQQDTLDNVCSAFCAVVDALRALKPLPAKTSRADKAKAAKTVERFAEKPRESLATVLVNLWDVLEPHNLEGPPQVELTDAASEAAGHLLANGKAMNAAWLSELLAETTEARRLQMTIWLQRYGEAIVEALRPDGCKECTSPVAVEPPAPPEQASRTDQAIALMLRFERERRKYIVDDLARTLGTSRATLYRDPRFVKARAVARAIRASLLSGHKDSSGNLEAYLPEREQEDDET